MTTNCLRRLALILLLAPAAALADNHRGIGGIAVLDAWYGHGDRLCDAGRSISRECDGHGSCDFNVGNRLCGDPTPGERKALWVAYRCGRGGDSVALFPEGERAYLRCDGGGFGPGPGLGRPPNRERNTIFIDQVAYGAGSRYCDATPVFARACDGRSRCEVRVTNRMCGDPYRGEKKLAEIAFWCNGRRETGSIREDDVAYLSCP